MNLYPEPKPLHALKSEINNLILHSMDIPCVLVYRMEGGLQCSVYHWLNWLSPLLGITSGVQQTTLTLSRQKKNTDHPTTVRIRQLWAKCSWEDLPLATTVTKDLSIYGNLTTLLAGLICSGRSLGFFQVFVATAFSSRCHSILSSRSWHINFSGVLYKQLELFLFS